MEQFEDTRTQFVVTTEEMRLQQSVVSGGSADGRLTCGLSGDYAAHRGTWLYAGTLCMNANEERSEEEI